MPEEQKGKIGLSQSREDWLDNFELQKLEAEAEKLKLLEEKEERKQRRLGKIEKLKVLEKSLNKKNKKAIKKPYRVLWQVSGLLTLLSILFIIYTNVEIFTSLFVSFWIFISLFFGGGLIMIGIYYLISVDKEQKLKEELIIENLKIAEDERKHAKQEKDEFDSMVNEVGAEMEKLEGLSGLDKIKQLQSAQVDPRTKNIPRATNPNLQRANEAIPLSQGDSNDIEHGLQEGVPVKNIGSSPLTELPESLKTDDVELPIAELDHSARLEDERPVDENLLKDNPILKPEFLDKNSPMDNSDMEDEAIERTFG